MEKHEKPGEGRNNNTAARSPQHRDYILFARIFVEIVQPLCSGTHLVGLETVPTRTRWHPSYDKLKIVNTEWVLLVGIVGHCECECG